VPWGEVGHGWYVTLVDQGSHGEFGIVAHHQLLDLVDPLGGRYQMARSSVGPRQSAYRTLADWSADGQEVLMMVGQGTSRARAVFLDLRYGTRHVEHLGRHVDSIALGQHGSVLTAEYGGPSGERIVRLDHDGSRHTLARHTDGTLLPSLTSDTLVVGTGAPHDDRLLVLRDASRSSIRTPEKCSAVRWWRPGVVLADCYGRSGVTRLYAAPVDGSPGHWVSADHGKKSRDLGDLDLRRLGGTTYLEAAGPCGVVFLARQHADGTATQVDVPGSRGNVYLLGTRGHRLVLESSVSCDGGRFHDAITHFDPATGHDTVVAALPPDEQYGIVLAFGEARASIG
jgi:TolB protein